MQNLIIYERVYTPTETDHCLVPMNSYVDTINGRE